LVLSLCSRIIWPRRKYGEARALNADYDPARLNGGNPRYL
jgi:hypothetical protein